MNTYACPSCARLNRVRPERRASDPKCGHCGTALVVSGAPVHVDDQGLDRLIRSSPVPVLLDFHADWCGPCRALSPHLEQLARNHPGALVVAKVDTEKHQRHAQRLGVRGIPALFLYKDGQVVDKASGLQPLAAWEQMVAPHLS